MQLNVKMESHFYNEKEIVIYQADFLNSTDIPNSSIDLIITSPPYNSDNRYKSNGDESYEEYLKFTEKWIKRCYRLAKDDGRFCLNIPLDENNVPHRSVCADITNIAKKIGWHYHSTVICKNEILSPKTSGICSTPASHNGAHFPVEVILILYKKYWKKINGRRENDITKQEFMDWTNGIWTFNNQLRIYSNVRFISFPDELPRRCIKLFSFVGDTVLDPFLRNGATLVAALSNNRKGIGVEADVQNCKIAVQRLQQNVKFNSNSCVEIT